MVAEERVLDFAREQASSRDDSGVLGRHEQVAGLWLSVDPWLCTRIIHQILTCIKKRRVRQKKLTIHKEEK